MAEGRSQSRLSTSDLLARLQEGDGTRAWKVFLQRFAPVILHIAKQCGSDQGRANDCFVFVCEKLSDHRFRRLLAFRQEGPASFRSWFKVVVANLCIDWQRQRQGRPRPFQSIAGLSALEQRVFKLRFEQGLGFSNCLNDLRTEFPDLSEPQLASAVERVAAVLTPQQFRLLDARRLTTVSADEPGWGLQAMQVADTAEGPESGAVIDQDHSRLNRALAGLEPRQRLLIKLRYQQDLSLKEVARLMRLGDPFVARRQIQAALEELARQLEALQ